MLPAKQTINGHTIDGEEFIVIVNRENQHSFWPSQKTIPEGWNGPKFKGSKIECTEYIDSHWVDLRPLSIQKQ